MRRIPWVMAKARARGPRWAVLCIGALLATALAAEPAVSAHDQEELAVARLLALPEAAVESSPTPTPIKQRYPWLIPRARRDRADERKGRVVHVAYVVPSDFPDQRLDRFGILEDSLRAQNHWMRRKAGLEWRLDTFRFRANGKRRRAVDVTYVASRRPAAQLQTLDDVIEVLRDRGMKIGRKRYLAYVATDAGGVCGEAEFPVVPEEGSFGQYTALYMYSAAGCGGQSFASGPKKGSWAEAIAQHELIHNDGAVPLVAPHDCRPAFIGHVCTPGAVLFAGLDPEERDLMFPFASGPLRKKKLDLGRDDYFRHPFPYRDLANSPFLVRAR